MGNRDILFTTDYSIFNNYEKQCKKRGFSYINCIKREQKFIKNLLKHKYNKTVLSDEMRVLVNIHADFGNRKEQDYKVLKFNCKDYHNFLNTDNYADLFSIVEIKNFLTFL